MNKSKKIYIAGHSRMVVSDIVRLRLVQDVQTDQIITS